MGVGCDTGANDSSWHPRIYRPTVARRIYWLKHYYFGSDLTEALKIEVEDLNKKITSIIGLIMVVQDTIDYVQAQNAELL